MGYYSLNGKRLNDFKVFCIWSGLAGLIFSHAHSLYLLAISTEPYTLFRILTLNVAATGMVVLLCIAVFFKKYLRAEFDQD